MKAIIPVAGNAKRLRPLTDQKPKALLEVAGKPVLSHILINLANNRIDDLVLIVGHKKEMLIQWAIDRYQSRFNLHFVEQREQLGLGHAIHTAGEFLDDDEVLIMLGDEILSRNYSKMVEDYRKDHPEIDGAVGIMIVQDPSNYGMIRVNDVGRITEMVEKPDNFEGNLALAGVYYFKRGKDLLEALDELLSTKCVGSEYQLTDALQIMVNNGKVIVPFSVGEGYDCGRPKSLLKSNRRMLINNHFIDSSVHIHDSEIIEPCYISKNARIIRSTVGPFASIGENAEITSSTISNVIVETNTHVIDSNSTYCIISGNKLIELNPKEIDYVLESVVECTTLNASVLE